MYNLHLIEIYMYRTKEWRPAVRVTYWTKKAGSRTREHLTNKDRYTKRSLKK